MMPSMKLILFFLLFNQILFAEIIGGVATDGYSPVLKYSIAEYSYSVFDGRYLSTSEKYVGSCTATRVTPQVILTAAHCFYDQLAKDFSRKYFHSNINDLSEKKYAPVKFDDDRIKVHEAFIHPDYIKMVGRYELQRIALLESFVANIITREEMNSKIKELDQQRVIEQVEFDVAIITTSSKSHQYYPILFDELKEGRRVEMVGYGLKVAPRYLSNLSLDILQLTVDIELLRFRLSNRLSVVGGITIEHFGREEASQIQASIQKKFKEVEAIEKLMDKHDYDLSKAVGYNQIADVTETHYEINGRAMGKQNNLESSISEGDSGGGLIVMQNEQRMTAGIASAINQSGFSRDGTGHIISKFTNISLSSNQEFIKSFLPDEFL